MFSRSRMESDIQRCTMDIQTTRTDLQESIAGAEWRAILSNIELCYRDIQTTCTDLQASIAGAEWRVIFSAAPRTYRQHALTYRQV